MVQTQVVRNLHLCLLNKFLENIMNIMHWSMGLFMLIIATILTIYIKRISPTTKYRIINNEP